MHDRTSSEPASPAERRDRFALIVADFEGQKSARREQFAGAREDRAVGGKPVRPAVERDARIVVAHLRLQGLRSRRSGYRAGCDTTTSNGPSGPSREVASMKADSRGDAEPLGVVARDIERRLRNVGRDAARLRQLRQKRDRRSRRSPVPRSQIVSSRQSRSRASRKHRLDQRLGLRPRHQRRRVQLERQAPEFLLAENARDRLAVRADASR